MKASPLLLALGLLASAFLTPSAAGEHTYSHRFVVEGRLIGANGLPLREAYVDLNVTGERFSQPCAQGHRFLTDEWGDFSFCYHRHEFSANAAVRVTAGNATALRPIDAELRRMVFLLQDEERNGTAPADWGVTYVVEGRVWERGAQVVDGVRVRGVALDQAPVQVKLVRPGNAVSTFDVSTDGYGDYRATFRLVDEEVPDQVGLRVHAANATKEGPLDLLFHRMPLDFRFPLEDAHAVRPPGERSGPVSIYLILAVMVGTLVAVTMARRKKTP